MSTAAKPFFTEDDFELLESAAEKFTGFYGEQLENELERAEVVSIDEIPDNVVTLHSRARVIDETTAREREITVLPPNEAAHQGEGQVSVLSPIGAAIIGLSEGQVIEWPMPSGGTRRFRVEKVLYQPEAARRRARIGAAPARSKGSPQGRKAQLAFRESQDPVERASIELFPASDAPGLRL